MIFTQNQTIQFNFPTMYFQPISKFSIHRKQSLQFQTLPQPFQLKLPIHHHFQQHKKLNQITPNLLSSYPLFQSSTKSRQKLLINQQPSLLFPLQQKDTKASKFLKSYNERLKRLRKRQHRLKSSLKDISITLIKQKQKNQDHEVTNNDRQQKRRDCNVKIKSRFNFSNNDINENKIKTKNKNRDKQKHSCKKTIEQKNPQLSLKSPCQPKSPQKNLTSQILVFKKSQFLDTSSTQLYKKTFITKDQHQQCRNKHNYDQTIHLLLKQIYDIKRQEEDKDKQKKEREVRCQSDKNNKINKKCSSFLTSYLSTYNHGFSLPLSVRKKYNLLQNQKNTILSPRGTHSVFNSTKTSRTTVKLPQKLTPVISFKTTKNPQNQTQITNNKQLLQIFRKQSNQKRQRIKLQKLYNFKTIDPWQIHQKNHNNKEYHQLLLGQLDVGLGCQ